MDKTRKQIKVKVSLPRLNIEEFDALTAILFSTYKEKHVDCARVLGINVRTWKRWNTHPPKWPYWNIVIRYILRNTISQIEGNRGFSKRHKDKLINALQALPRGEEDPLLEELEEKSYITAASVSHLRLKLIKGGMFKDELFTTANLGGFSHKAMEMASKRLGVVKTQEGFGSHKRSYWRLPNEDDD